MATSRPATIKPIARDRSVDAPIRPRTLILVSSPTLVAEITTNLQLVPEGADIVGHYERANERVLMTEDLQMTCSDCGQEFTFSREDQAFFQDRGYSIPKRCRACRQAKKNEQGGGGGFHPSQSQGTTVTCSACGKQTTVPFEPRGDRPVYCQDCYRGRNRDGGGRGARRHRR